MIDTVIFDMDGTVLNTLDDIYEGINNALLICGFPIKTKDEVRNAVGDGVAMLVKRCIPVGEESRLGEFEAIYRAEYSKCQAHRTAPYPNVIRLMKRLRERGITVAIVSNKPDGAVKALSDKWFSGLVDLAIGDDGVRKVKPSPEPIGYALTALNKTKEQAVYVGDQEVDVLTAKNSGVRLLAAGWGFRGKELLEQAGADTVLSSPMDILAYLE